MSTTFRLALILSIAVVGSRGSLVGQEDSCFDFPESIPLNLDGGQNLWSGACLSPDGKTLYYAASFGNIHDGSSWIMKVARNEDEEFNPDDAVRLGSVVNAPGTWTGGPRVSPDGRWLYFHTLRRPNSINDGSTLDVWVAWNGDPDDPDTLTSEADFDNAQIVPDINSPDNHDRTGCVSPLGTEYIGARHTYFGVARFNVPHHPLQGFTEPRELLELNHYDNYAPSFSTDGCTLVWSDPPSVLGDRPRQGRVGGADLWMAVRPSVDEPFVGPPIRLPVPPNSASDELAPTLWNDGQGTDFLLYTNAFGLQQCKTVSGLGCPEPPPPSVFLRGDANDDGGVNIADALYALNWLFAEGPEPTCHASANSNGDGGVNVSDPVYLLNFLFAGGPTPVAPHPDCGTSELPADDELGCETPTVGCEGA